jgi:hypothetical protein
VRAYGPSAESALAEATEIVRMVDGAQLQGVFPFLARSARAFLSRTPAPVESLKFSPAAEAHLDALERTPAPAAKAERPNDGRSGRCGIRISGDHWCTLDHGHAGEHSVALTLCTEAERRVLEACAAFPTAALKHDAQINRNELSDLSLRWTEAELARRGQP